ELRAAHRCSVSRLASDATAELWPSVRVARHRVVRSFDAGAVTDFLDSQPVTATAIVTLIGALLAVAIAFGAPITDQQRDAILALATAVVPIAFALIIRPNVTPNALVEARIKHAVSDAVMSMGSAGPAPH